MRDKKSIYWINAVRAFAIIAVFLSHVQSVYGYSIGLIHAFISPWYVNAFFFISGYLLFRKQLSAPLINQDRFLYINKLENGGGDILLSNVMFRIVIPTILFAAIEYFPSCLLQGREMSLSYGLYKTVGGGTYWFTSALAVSELIILLLLLTRIKHVWFYFAACLILGAVGMAFQHGMYVIEPWAAHRGIVALLLLGSGGVYWKYEAQVSSVMKWYVVLLMLVAYIVIILFCNNTNPNISILSLQPWGIVTTLLSCLLLIEFCKHLPENKFMTYVGKNTLCFYFTSGALPIVLSMFAHKLIPGCYLWVMLAVWIACLVLASIIVMIINKWLPWVLDLRLLNKKRK